MGNVVFENSDLFFRALSAAFVVAAATVYTVAAQ